MLLQHVASLHSGPSAHGRILIILRCLMADGHGWPWMAMMAMDGHGWPWMAMDGQRLKRLKRLKEGPTEKEISRHPGHPGHPKNP